MKKTVVAFAYALVSLAAQAAPTFVGSYRVNEGPFWPYNPPVYSATEAAALIFGGTKSDYFISIANSLDPTTITHTAWYDGWGEHEGMEFDENYKLDIGEPGYADPGGFGSARSAYVRDGLDDRFVNYVWRATPVVPEPAPVALLAVGAAALPLLRRRRLTWPGRSARACVSGGRSHPVG